jgi:signal transduction histidine kinase
VRTRLLNTEGSRLAAIFVVLFALTAAALSASTVFIVRQQFENQIIQFARADIAAVRLGFAAQGEREGREVVGQRLAGLSGSDFMLMERGAAKLAGNLPPMAPQTGVLRFPAPGKGADHVVLGVGAFIGPNVYVFSGSDLYAADQARARIVQTMIWIFAAAMLLSVAGGAIVSRRVLSRTDAIERACREIMDGHLRTRIATTGSDDELDRLAATINRMLDRMSDLMEDVRQVTNDVAHDLRTPLTHLRHRLERARHQSVSEADYDRAMEAAIAACDDILTLFAALLRIAQIEGGARRSGFREVELFDLLNQLKELFAPVADDAHHSLTVEVEWPLTVRGDRELLTHLFSNLIENAILHTPPGTRITMTGYEVNGMAEVTVADSGPGVPQEEHPKLFQRLYRGEPSRGTPGYGLGLALVRAIAELHGVILTTGTGPEGGFAVTMRFALRRS